MKIFENHFLVIIVLFLFSSCANKPKDNKEEAKDIKDTKEIVVASETYSVDVEKSSIKWTGTKLTGKHYGTVAIKEGNIGVNEGSIVSGTVVVDLNSIVCLDLEEKEMNAKLVNHLKSPDFFEVEKYPDATFEITGIEGIEEDPIKLEVGEMLINSAVTGDLTMKDSVKCISFEALIEVNEDQISVASNNFTIDRTDWGVNHGSKKIFDNLKDKFIDDEIILSFELVANK